MGERASLCPRASRARASSNVAANSEPTTSLRPTPVLLRSKSNEDIIVSSSYAECFIISQKNLLELSLALSFVYDFKYNLTM